MKHVTQWVAVAALVCPAVAFAQIDISEDVDETLIVGEPWDPDYEPPRMPDGTPDMQGIWTNASITSLERPDGVENLVLTPQQAAGFRGVTERLLSMDTEVTDPDAPPPEEGGEIRGYNAFWTDPGNEVARIDGEFRSSWIVEPEDGKLPYSLSGAATFLRYGQRMFSNFDDPEVRSAGERCTVGFGSTGGPPMMNVLYNNHYQIVQTPETVAIVVEMNHNARLIRIDDEHRPDIMRGWLGDSIGRWEGDTLVVETTNFHPDHRVRGAIRHRFFLSTDALVEERFTRVSDAEIFYEFTVTDPKIYRQPWRGEMVLVRDQGPMFEYACHEGNYALPNILGGARREEADAAEAGE